MHTYHMILSDIVHNFLLITNFVQKKQNTHTNMPNNILSIYCYQVIKQTEDAFFCASGTIILNNNSIRCGQLLLLSKDEMTICLHQGHKGV